MESKSFKAFPLNAKQIYFIVYGLMRKMNMYCNSSIEIAEIIYLVYSMYQVLSLSNERLRTRRGYEFDIINMIDNTIYKMQIRFIKKMMYLRGARRKTIKLFRLEFKITTPDRRHFMAVFRIKTNRNKIYEISVRQCIGCIHTISECIHEIDNDIASFNLLKSNRCYIGDHIYIAIPYAFKLSSIRDQYIEHKLHYTHPWVPRDVISHEMWIDDRRDQFLMAQHNKNNKHRMIQTAMGYIRSILNIKTAWNQVNYRDIEHVNQALRFMVKMYIDAYYCRSINIYKMVKLLMRLILVVKTVAYEIICDNKYLQTKLHHLMITIQTTHIDFAYNYNLEKKILLRLLRKTIKKKCFCCNKLHIFNRRNSKCKRCRSIFYCSKRCQKIDWGYHRNICFAR